jgi:hypothetical protein
MARTATGTPGHRDDPGNQIWLAALASPPSPPVATVHLELSAAPDCATDAELIARVAARSTRIHFGPSGTGTFELRVEIAPGPNDAQLGRLSLIDPSGRRSNRRLTAPTCAETVDAVALVAVISLDPSYAPSGDAPAARDLAADGQVAPPAGNQPDGDRAEVSTPARRASERAAADRPPVPAGVGPAHVEGDAETAAPPPISARRHLGAGVAGQLISGPAPHPMPAVAVHLFAALDRPSIWSPALRLTVQHGWQNGVDEPGGTADFALDTVALDLCFLRLSVAAVDLRGCATATAGRLSASGSDTFSPASQARPFLAAGGTAILEIALGRWVTMAGSVGAADTPIHDAFEFSPVIFHRVSATTLTFDLGMGVRFP